MSRLSRATRKMVMQRGAGSLALPLTPALYTGDINGPSRTSWVSNDSVAEAGGHLPQGHSGQAFTQLSNVRTIDALGLPVH